VLYGHIKEHTLKIALSAKANLLELYISTENRKMTRDTSEIMIEFTNNPATKIGEINKNAVAE
jgi:hypothetical protein